MNVRSVLFSILLLPVFSAAQDIGAITHNLNNGTYTVGGTAVQDRGAVFTYRYQAAGTQTGKFLWHLGSGNYSTKWAANTATPYSVNTKHVGGAILNGGLDIPVSVTDQKYYTFIVEKGNTSGNKDFSVLETTFNPVAVTNVSFSPSAPNSGQYDTVSATLSGTKNGGEHLFIRWTVDNFTTSSFAEITTFVGNTGKAVIPPQSAGAVVTFYVFTTLLASPSASTIDYHTLEFENNSNANYSYAVSSNGTTTFNTPSIGTGTPLANGFRANEKLATVNGTDFYFTWDAQNLYVAFSGACNSTTDRFNIAIDADPAGTSGTTMPFSGLRFPLGGHLPDYIVQVIGTGSVSLFQNLNGSWSSAAANGFGQYGDGSNGSNMKIKIPFSALQGATGMSAYSPANPIQFLCWISGASQDKPYRVAPESNTQGDLSLTVTGHRTYYFSSLSAAVAPSLVAADSALTLVPTTFLLNLAASVGSVNDNNNLLGTAAAATNGYDFTFDIPKPPAAPGNSLQISFPHPEFSSFLGPDYSNDIRADFSSAGANVSWGFHITTNVANSNVTFTAAPDGRIPSNLGIFLIDSSANANLLVNLKTANFIYSYNSGASPGVRKFALILVDTLNANITLLSPNGGEIFRSGTTQTISFSRTGAAATDSVVLSFSPDNGVTYSQIAVIHGGSTTYLWTIPSYYYNTQGKIRAVLTDVLGKSAAGYSANPFTIVGDSLAVTLQQGWNLFGSPLPGSYSSLSPQLSSGAGFLFGFSPTAGYAVSNGLSDGTGYWLGLQNAKKYFVKGIAHGGGDSVVLPVAQGFNLISDPFVLPIARDGLIITQGSSRATFQGAVTNGWISSQLYKYSSGSYTSADTLKLFEGYWIGVLQSGVSVVTKPSIPVSAYPAPTRLVASNTKDFVIQISAQFGGLTDELLRFGVQAKASDNYDALDAPKPPRSPAADFIETYFLRPEWSLPLGDRMAYDILRTGGSWRFTVNTSSVGPVTLRWNADAVSPARSLDLYDVSTGQSVPMKSSSSYTYTSNRTHEFEITSILTGVGRDELNLPSFTLLNQCYPNPFNPTTMISYQLSANSFTSLIIYDAIGREVATLVNEVKDAGYYSAQFDGALFSSGTYYAKLTAGGKSQVKKLLLVK